MRRLINYLFKSDKVFASGICKEKLFFIFLFGCIFGCVYEELLTVVFDYINGNPIVWVTRRGLIYGELSPVYGIGALALVFALCRKERAWYKNYLYGALAGGAIEYVTSFLQEKIFGTISWDYSGLLLSVGGRTTVPFMLFWGLLALLMVYIIYPLLSSLIEKIPYNLGMILYKILFILVTIDIFISFGAAIRQAFRRLGLRPFSPLGDFFDKYYFDERLAKVYNNAIVK